MTTPILQYDETSGKVVAMGATLRDGTTTRLQNALNALAKLRNNPAIKVTADGVLGPKTVGAVNLAIKTYAPDSKLPLPLSITQVRTQQGPIAEVFERYVRMQSMQAPAVPKPSVSSNSILRLQKALKQLSPLVNDRGLDVVADGKMGPKTTAAVNLAVIKYLSGNQKVPAKTQDFIVKNAVSIADAIEKHAARLKKPGQVALVKQATVDAAKAKNPVAAKAIDKAAILQLQKALVALGTAIKVKALQIKADGVMGPKTQAATNLALSRHVRGVTAALKKGNLSQKEITSGAVALAQLITNEIAARKVAPPSKAVPPTVKKTTDKVASASAAKDAKNVIPPKTERAVMETTQEAFQGDNESKGELQTVAAATQSSDPEVALNANAALDVADETSVEIGPAEILSDDAGNVLSYLDERGIEMDRDLIEDTAELGAHIGLHNELSDMGWSLKSIAKGAAKGVSKGVTSAAQGATYAAKKAGQAAMSLVDIHKIILGQVAIPLARVLCSIPKPIIIAGAQAANTNPQVVLLFCAAVRAKNKKAVLKLLPGALKIAAKISATGAVPALAPVFRTINLIPSVIRKQIPGLSMMAGWQDDIISGNAGCY